MPFDPATALDPKNRTHVGDAVIYRVSGHERVPHPKDPRAAPVAAFPVAQLGALLPARIVEDWGGQCIANAHPNLDVFPSSEIDVGEPVRVPEAWYGCAPSAAQGNGDAAQGSDGAAGAAPEPAPGRWIPTA